MTGRALALLLEQLIAGRHPDEASLQLSVKAALRGQKLSFFEEFGIASGDRLDFLVADTIAVELKVKGSVSALTRQLHRYAKHEVVRELVLVTTRVALTRVPNVLSGKPVAVALISAGAF